jgi:hypothetical protein
MINRGLPTEGERADLEALLVANPETLKVLREDLTNRGLLVDGDRADLLARLEEAKALEEEAMQEAISASRGEREEDGEHPPLWSLCRPLFHTLAH